MTQFKSEFLRILTERGFFNQCTNEEGFDAYLYECEKTGTPAVGYLGSDPTADSLHVGHLFPVMMMRWFQKLGNKPIMLVGGATARIGDPSGKDKLRPFMSSETIAHNIDGLKDSYSRFIRFDDTPSGAIMVDNYDWFKDINYLEFLRDVGTYYSVNRMLTMDSVKTRLEREQQMSFLEFNYQLLQGYDFCRLYEKYGCRAQISGSDQWGNITSGTELGRRKYDVELFGFTCPILTDASGKKMGKSEGNAAWVNESKLSSYDYYQYFRNIGDTEVGKCLRIFTEFPMDEVRRLEALKDKEINEAKKILAFEATKLCRGEEAAKAAAETARKTFEEGVGGGELPTIAFAGDIALTEALVQLKLTASKGEAKRLIAQNGVKVNDAVVAGDNIILTAADMQNGQIKLSVGKKKHGLIK
ncbi:MAG: tyrosine--tRNA ligase [Alphaproteobacteria bacterium]|nr:tyrosine--tRNA ligase [Alphaproteobacteria bacterium]MBO4644451.1 tyrosine--tRNA ligase [Alphaproteobacteria bacterium]